MQAAELFIEVTGDVTQATAAMGQIERDVMTTGQRVEQAGQGFTRMGAAATGAVAGIAASLTNLAGGYLLQAPAMLLGKLGDAIDLASDKAEAASKVNVLFGDSVDIITEASKNSVQAVGVASGKYLALAGDIGNLVTNFGFAGDEAAHMSKDIVQLAADMGSFNNANTEDVVYAIGAAFRGETEPIRKYGVMLSQAGIEAKAMEMGLVSAGEEMDAQAKAAATYALILEQTTEAQGDFARTAEGHANKTRINAARMEEAWTKVGEAIKPIATLLGTVVADAIVGILDLIMAVVDGWNDFATENSELIESLSSLAKGALKLLGDAFGAVLDAGQKVIDLALGPLKPLVVGVAGALTATLIPSLIRTGVVMGTQLIAKAAELVTMLSFKLIPALGDFSFEIDSAGRAAGRAGLGGALTSMINPMNTFLIVAGLAAVAAMKLAEAWGHAQDYAEGLVDSLPELNDGLLTSSEAASAHAGAMEQFTEDVEDYKQRIASEPPGLSNAWGIAKPLENLAVVFGELMGQEAISQEINAELQESYDALSDTVEEGAQSARDARDAQVAYTTSHRDAIAAARENAGAVNDWSNRVQHSAVAVTGEYQRTAERFAEVRGEILETARALGEGVPGEIGRGMMQESRAVLDGAQALRDILENGLTPEQQAMEAIGKDYAKLLRQGMNSEIPGAKETAIQLAVEAIRAIEAAGLQGAKGQRGLERVGQYYDMLLANGMDQESARVALEAAGVASDVIDRLEGKGPQFQNTGEDWDADVAAGVRRNGDQVEGAMNGVMNHEPPISRWASKVGESWTDAVARAIRQGDYRIAQAMRNAMRAGIGHSPPVWGPLRHVDVWGKNIGEAWAEGVSMGLDNIIMPALRRPNMPGLATGRPAFATAVAGAGGGAAALVQVTVNGNVYGGPAGLRALKEEIEDAVRSGQRGGGHQVGRQTF